MKQKVRITDHDGNRATMQRLLQRLEKPLLIDHSACHFAMTNYRHCEERGTNDEAISTIYR